jgi:RNA polymerase sigma-70 factor (ECF subfamily)
MPWATNELFRTRATLLQRLKDWQDQASWQDFFDIYWRLIYSVAREAGLTDPESQDVVQETMLSVAKYMPGFKYDPALGSFKAWLLNLTRWRIIDQFRKRRGLETRGPGTSHSTAGMATVEKVVDPATQALEKLWDSEWEHHLLGAALARLKRRLDPQKYQIFDFSVNKNWTPEKVARTFGISVDQVYLARHRVGLLVKEEVKRLEKEIL